MKRLWISVSLVWLGAVAAAQTPPPLTVVPPTERAPSWVDTALPEGASRPSGYGSHNCLNNYPEAAKAAQVEGTTALTYRITEDGSVKGIKVSKSSGNAALDKAAVACVKSWRYAPATLEGKPVEIPWRNEVKWVLAVYVSRPLPPPPHDAQPSAVPPGPPPPPPVNGITVQSNARPPLISTPASIGQPHVCSQFYPPDAIVEHADGSSKIAFKITVEGTTKDIHVVQSSGFAVLDDAAVTCVSGWRYKPAVKDSQPIEVPWQAIVKWVVYN